VSFDAGLIKHVSELGGVGLERGISIFLSTEPAGVQPPPPRGLLGIASNYRWTSKSSVCLHIPHWLWRLPKE
jgi:hypothetical protein